MRKSVCVDLDGVLLRMEGRQLGRPYPGAVEFTRRLAEFADVVILTSRCSSDFVTANTVHLAANEIRRHLDEHGITYHHIHTDLGKPVASAYIDDRAVACRPHEVENAFDLALNAARALTTRQ